MIKSLSSLVLHVSNVERSADFYRELGFQDAKTDGEARELRINWFKVRFEPMKKLGGPGYTRGAGIHIGLSVDDLAATKKKLEALGLEPSQQGNDKSGNLLVADPDGFQLLFYRAKV